MKMIFYVWKICTRKGKVIFHLETLKLWVFFPKKQSLSTVSFFYEGIDFSKGKNAHITFH